MSSSNILYQRIYSSIKLFLYYYLIAREQKIPYSEIFLLKYQYYNKYFEHQKKNFFNHITLLSANIFSKQSEQFG